jgi:hypothetical protein
MRCDFSRASFVVAHQFVRAASSGAAMKIASVAM